MLHLASALGIGFAVLWIGIAIGFFATFAPLIIFSRCELGIFGHGHSVRRQFPRERAAYTTESSMRHFEHLFDPPLPEKRTKVKNPGVLSRSRHI